MVLSSIRRSVLRGLHGSNAARVFAVCHPRGGGWYGEAWHHAGMITTKPHTWQDFVACGKWLIAHKYTSPAHLAGEGTSAGGITIGRAITTQPHLFAAALDVVGASNAFRMEFSPNGPPNIPEFGTVTNEVGFKALYAMDAYEHVVPGTAYPAVMLVTGYNDPRVASWELAKFTARLQKATTSGRPILLRVDYDAGHGFLAASRKQSEELLTDEYSFLLWQCGDPAFAGIPTPHLPSKLRLRIALAMPAYQIPSMALTSSEAMVVGSHGGVNVISTLALFTPSIAST